MASIQEGGRVVTLIGGRDGARIQMACAGASSSYSLGVDPGLWGMAPSSITSTRRGLIPGETVEGVRAEPSLIPFPVTVVASSPSELDERLRYLSTLCAPDKPVRVRVESLGASREITAYYYTGLEAISVRDHRSTTTKVPLILKAFDPFWRDTAADDPSVGAIFWNALVGGSNYEPIINASDVPETWPEIEIVGPIENVHIMNHEHGALLRVLEVLAVNDTLTIVTDPARRGVWFNGVRSRASLDSRSVFWSLKPGLNRVSLRGSDQTGGGSPGSYVISWAPRFASC